MWVSEVSKRFTKNEMEIEKPEGIVCKKDDPKFYEVETSQIYLCEYEKQPSHP